MKLQINIPDYSSASGFKLHWQDNFKILVKVSNSDVIISANKEGLESLANHLLSLAQNEVPVHTHIHLDENNGLESGSINLIIEKK